MARLRVDWNLLSPVRVPDGIRASVETRLAALWRFLDRCVLAEPLPSKGRCRSEEFEMNVHPWTFTYEIDLANGAAVIRQVVNTLI
jgi:hypothetical protein